MIHLDRVLLGFIIYFYELAIEQRKAYIKDELTVIAVALKRIIEEKELIESFNEKIADVQNRLDTL